MNNPEDLVKIEGDFVTYSYITTMAILLKEY